MDTLIWDKMPTINGMQLWGCKFDLGQFVIMEDNGEFIATYKRSPTDKLQIVIGREDAVSSMHDAIWQCVRFQADLTRDRNQVNRCG